MKLHNAWPFTRWLLGRMFGGVARIYGKYDYMICDQPALAVMPTMLISLVSIIPMLIIFSVLGIFEYVHYSWLVFSALVFSNYFRIILREQYKRFAEERREFLNEFKGE